MPGSGTINPPSITVYARTAQGNAAPLRKIQGPDTGLNWPTGLAFDPQARELFVANDAAHEILVFDAAANGNAKPKRSAEGREHEARQPHRRRSPTRRTASCGSRTSAGTRQRSTTSRRPGNVAPKRIIRNAPENTPSLMIGNPGAVGYDPKREEILVPN